MPLVDILRAKRLTTVKDFAPRTDLSKGFRLDFNGGEAKSEAFVAVNGGFESIHSKPQSSVSPPVFRWLGAQVFLPPWELRDWLLLPEDCFGCPSSQAKPLGRSRLGSEKLRGAVPHVQRRSLRR